MQYQHFTIEEREKIQERRWKKESIRAIAKELHRSPSSISREIKRNKPPERNVYTPRLAHEHAQTKRKSRGRAERLKNNEVRQYLRDQLEHGWSPEQIAATCKSATGTSISHEAIYQYIYAQIHRNGHGMVRTGCDDLRSYLPRRRKRRIAHGGRRTKKIQMAELPSIDDRPAVVERRKQVGHWEDDLVVSHQSSDNLKTINERVSGVVFIGRVKNKTIEEGDRVVTERLESIPSLYRKTLTRDRGTENLGYRQLEKNLALTCYFAHPYHSWERGSNENTNGLIRRFLPKKTDFHTVTDNEISRIEFLLNSRPRKRLGWKTPYEVFLKKTGIDLSVGVALGG
jgi:transposase, IS30 family